MMQVKRVVCDFRGPEQNETDVEIKLNSELIKLQENTQVTVRDIKELTKDSGKVVFLVIYDLKL